jgi:hypothetical protein
MTTKPQKIEMTKQTKQPEREGKYKILIDNGVYEGVSFWDDGHDDLDEAVKVAQANSYGSKFYIIKVIEWEAKQI